MTERYTVTPRYRLDALNAALSFLRLDSLIYGGWGPDIASMVASTRTFAYFGGSVKSGSTISFIPDGTIVCPDATTVIVQRNAAGTVSQATTLGATNVPMAVVTCAGGLLTHFEDVRDAGVVPHTHAASDVTTGILAIGRVASGTPTGSKFVRDDSTLADISVTIGAATAALQLMGTFQAKYQANLGFGGFADDDPVGTWSDQTTNSLHLTSISGSTDRPTYKTDPDGDGIPCIRFDGSNDGLRKRAMASYTGTSLTIYAVVRSNERGTDRGAIRFDDQSHAQANALCSSLSWSSSNAFAQYERGGGSARYSPLGTPTHAQSGVDGAYRWRVIALVWGAVGGVSVLRMWDNADGTAVAPTGAGSAFGITRLSIGGVPNDSTDAWVSSNYLKSDWRFLGYCHEAHTEAQVKNNIQYLAANFAVGAIL